MILTFDLKTRFYLIRKIDGKVLDTKYIGEPFVFFHTINAFEDKNHVVIDICCYPDNKVINALTEKYFREVIESKVEFEAKSEVRRFVLPLMEHFNKVFNYKTFDI